MYRVRWRAELLRSFSLGLLSIMGLQTAAVSQAQSDLQSKVDQLQSSLAQTQSQLSESRAEIDELRKELNALKVLVTPQQKTEATSQDTSGMYPTLGNVQSAPQTEPASTEQQELAARVEEQAQTKVESGSRYKVRLSGLILMNTYANMGRGELSDMPSLAFSRVPNQSHGDLGFTFRQTQIGLAVTGPRIAGALTSGDVQADFFGGFPNINYGVTAGIFRLRTAHLQMEWPKTKIVAEQDAPFVSPLSPTSYATMGEPALSWAGNLWVWTPQIHVDHRWSVSESSSITVQGGILDALTEQIPPTQFNRVATPGELAKWPAFASRVAWNGKWFGREALFGVGGLYGQQVYGFGRNIDSWLGTIDWNFPLGQYFTLSGEFYRGQAIGGLGGGVWNSVLYNGPQNQASTEVIPLNDIGGWSQLKFQPAKKWEFNVAAGTANPLSSDLREYPVVTGAYFPPFARNQVMFVNSIYHPRSNLTLALEYRKLRSYALSGTKQSLDHVNLAIGVAF
jgi:hypothetical protein